MNRQAEPTSVQQQQATEHNHPRAEPLQVTLQFTQTGQRVRIAWDSDVIGMTTSSFSPPYTGQDLRLVIRALDALQYPNYPQGAPTCTPDEQARLKALGLWNTGGISREAPRIVGQKLYAALCRSRSGAEALKVVREAARSQGRPLSYVLRFPSDAVELAALPWEALWDERQAVLLSRGGRDIDSCERYLNLDIALSPPIPSGRKLHVLALSPHTGIPQNVRDEERDARLKSWEMLKEQGLLEWDEISPVTVVSLDNWMRQNTVPDIVHYYGHGIYRNGQGSLLFDSHEQPGQPDMISASRLAAILGGIRLIMLFACQSAMVATSESDIGLLTGVAPALSVVSEIVVAMQLTTRISAANRFSEIFYEELARGRSVQAAVADARRSLYVTEGDGMSWYVPTLYIRTREQKPIAIRSDL
jgi:energy-coupling factor transporter transmembrane protein EcfT